MKVEVEDISKVEKKVEIELEAEMVADEIEEQFKELKDKAQVKGFRPGKAPRKMLERLFKDYVYEKVIEKLVKETMETALSRKNIIPVVEPVIDPAKVAPGEPFKYTLHVEIKPEIENLEYKGLEVRHQDEEVNEEEMQKTLDGLRDSVALIQEPETPRPIQAGDQVTAEVKVKEGETEVPFGKDEEQVIELWRKSWIPGLVEQLTGRAVGDEVEFTVQIPEGEGAPKEYQGRTLSFFIKIKGIKERVLPELNDQFAKEYTKHEHLEELKAGIRQNLAERAQETNRGRLENKVVEELVKKNPIEVPPTQVKIESAMIAKIFMARNFRKMPTDEEALKFADMFENDARHNLQARYLIGEIAKKEALTATAEELEEEIKLEAERAGTHPDKFKARLEDKQKESIKQRVIMNKALDFLVREANIKEGVEPGETGPTSPEEGKQEGEA